MWVGRLEVSQRIWGTGKYDQIYCMRKFKEKLGHYEKTKDFIIMYFQRDIYLIVLLANDWLLIIAKCVFVSNKTLEFEEKM